ncbi:MAG: DUF2809 domain-containing protein [Micrococcales bacterium]|nr:DUF2809 domain-containing protein [Micrococcales bacterium]
MTSQRHPGVLSRAPAEQGRGRRGWVWWAPSWGFVVGAVVLLGVEAAIAVGLTGGFVREHVGDVLVVVLVYCVVRCFVRARTGVLPLAVFVFAAGVELSQKLGLIETLGLGDVAVARAVLGTTFDLSDIVCYAVGCLALFVAEIVARSTNPAAARQGTAGGP